MTKILGSKRFQLFSVCMMLVALVLDPWEFVKWFVILVAPGTLGFYLGFKYQKGELE